MLNIISEHEFISIEPENKYQPMQIITDNFQDKDLDNHRGGERGGYVSIGGSPVQPRRHKLSRLQREQILGNLPCGTSDKVLSQNKALCECVLFLYEHWLKCSNGGLNPAALNQHRFSSNKKTSYKTKMTFSDGTIKRAIDFMIANDLLSIYSNSYQVNKNSKKYVGGLLTEELMDDECDKKLRQQLRDGRNRERYEACGINYDKPVKCQCCENLKHVRNFKLWEDSLNLSITCHSCWKWRKSDCQILIAKHCRERNIQESNELLDTRIIYQPKSLFDEKSRNALNIIIRQ